MELFISFIIGLFFHENNGFSPGGSGSRNLRAGSENHCRPDKNLIMTLPIRADCFMKMTDYIIPMLGLAAAAGVSSLMLATTDSVVSRVAATLVAF